MEKNKVYDKVREINATHLNCKTAKEMDDKYHEIYGAFATAGVFNGTYEQFFECYFHGYETSKIIGEFNDDFETYMKKAKIDKLGHYFLPERAKCKIEYTKAD